MKKNTRIKAPVLATRAEFEAHVDQIARLTTELRALEVARDHAVEQILEETAAPISDLQEQIKAKVALCEKYAEANRAELLPGKAKSAETPLARFGFRLGNRTVALLNRKITWTEILGVLKARNYRSLIRITEEVNKEAVLAGTDEHGTLRAVRDVEGHKVPTSTALVSLGLKINQVESFYIEPKVAGAETVKAGA